MLCFKWTLYNQKYISMNSHQILYLIRAIVTRFLDSCLWCDLTFRFFFLFDGSLCSLGINLDRVVVCSYSFTVQQSTRHSTFTIIPLLPASNCDLDINIILNTLFVLISILSKSLSNYSKFKSKNSAWNQKNLYIILFCNLKNK